MLILERALPPFDWKAFYRDWSVLFEGGALPEAQLGNHFGYFRFGLEIALDAEEADAKEFFQGDESTTWPELVRQQSLDLLLHIRTALANCPESVFAEMPTILSNTLKTKSHMLMRIVRYPGSRRGAVLNHPHHDICLFTALPASNEPGLEIHTELGWRPVSIGPADLVLLTGEMAELLSGGHARAERHRVVSPGPDRLAVSVFVNLNEDVVLPTGERAGEVFRRRLSAVSPNQ